MTVLGPPSGDVPASGTAAWRRVLSACALGIRAAPLPLSLYLVLTLAGAALPVLAAWLTKLLLDGLAAGTGSGPALRAGAGLAAVGLLAGLLPPVTGYLRGELDRAVGLLAQDRLFTSVAGFAGLARFEDPVFLDRLRLAEQAGRLTPNQTIEGLVGALRAVVTVAGFLGSLFTLSPTMTLLVLACAVPSLLAETVLARRRARVYWEIGPAERREIFYSTLLSTVAAAKEVRLFAIGDFLRGRMLADRRTADAARRRMDRGEAVVQAGLMVLAALVTAGGLIWAVSAAAGGVLTLGDVTIFVAAVAGVQGSLTSLTGEVARTHHALLMFDHYLAVTGAGPDLPAPAEPRSMPALRHGIELHDVWFRYSGGHPWVLRGVTLHIPCGGSLALVGLNGAGKSTLVKLLCRFYDPTRGSIRWDGVDIRDVDVAELRRRIGAVFQDYMCYDMSAAENIGVGDLSALDDPPRLRAAARLAGIDERISALPHGYRTLLSRDFADEPDGDGSAAGVLLSGGQWQRLALARAFLRDRRDLLILDEPSAGLDAAAEHEIHRALRRHRQGRTSVLISHRLNTVRGADHIVVLADGVIAEQGRHDELMAAGGRYATLFSLQADGYLTDSPPALPADR
ncbi:ABC transporter ATP-binding protein [Actinoplanes flavus]|uniref:ABC transporter ATP-binding protein n=1 Tax=Actinoplanes flavus TaxID=2820290 RepID=A0ABS3V0N5_9ACTN|nr:ABC transporter ATP-binding protein [Actinoplanes flavus]MBO3744377.1 ABC transporter ATP-binding protein [Actinoplanes flavus]